MKSISVIIPMFREESRIPSTLREIELFVKKYPDMIEEVICIDDGSRDRTSEECMRFIGKIPLRLERFEQNKGKWAAIHHGIRLARTDAVLLMDADGSCSVWELGRMMGIDGVCGSIFEAAMEGKICVFGSRYMFGSSVVGKSWSRQVVSRVYRRYAGGWYWFATGWKDVYDMQCPFKLIFRSKMQKNVLVVERFAGDIEIACAVKGKIVNWPVQFLHKRGSKVPFSAIFSMMWETVEVALRWRKILRTE